MEGPGVTKALGVALEVGAYFLVLVALLGASTAGSSALLESSLSSWPGRLFLLPRLAMSATSAAIFSEAALEAARPFLAGLDSSTTSSATFSTALALGAAFLPFLGAGEASTSSSTCP